jgi:hypothetical protein
MTIFYENNDAPENYEMRDGDDDRQEDSIILANGPVEVVENNYEVF